MYSYKIYSFILFATLALSIFEANANDEGCYKELKCLNDRLQNNVDTSTITVNGIKGNEHGLKFALPSAHLDGMSQCEVVETHVDESELTIHHGLLCRELVLWGDYALYGVLLGAMPLYGNGTFTVACEHYEITFDLKPKCVSDPDGKETLKIDSYDLNLQPKNMVFDYKNLYNGNKQMSDIAHNLANKHWKYVAKQFQYPMVGPFIEKYIEKALKSCIN